ncbi:MAG: hypothetical protein LZF60_250140 [Nitrospira sp.]|nr:hypothetical protein [Nitrospira sp.]ULA60560.1 MAG: hypothetical protein LZF60_250140 [Nitrospira sp.]
MDQDLVAAKLESLRRCVERIAGKTPPSSQDLAQAADLQDIIALNLQRAGAAYDTEVAVNADAAPVA